MFSVRCSPRPVPPNPQSLALPPCAHTLCVCATVARKHLPLPGPQLAPHRVPCVRPSPERVRLQPAAQLGHLKRRSWALVAHELDVLRARLPALCAPQTCSRTFSPLHAACTPRLRPRVYPREARLVPLTPYTTPYTPCALLVRLGSAQTPCPPPTSCSSAARGRAPPPSPALAITRAGRREAAPEALIEVCVRPRQSLWRLPVHHSPQRVRGVHTYTDVREGRKSKRAAAAAA